MLATARTYTCFSRLAATAAAAVLLGAAGAQAADTPLIPTLKGTWKAQELKVPANTELDQEEWGKGASKVRNVQLLLEPNGSGTLRIESSVVDAQGRPKKYSQAVVDAKLTVAEPPDTGDRVKPPVTILSAEERYLDDPKDVRKIEGLRLKLDMPSRDSGILNIFYETPEGNGSFGETLRRPTTQASARGTGSR